MAVVDRHFLGWDRQALDLAAEWLERKYGPDLSRVVVVLPGARAGRALQERLIGAQPPHWQPPSFITAGRLTDLLVRLERPSASRLVRSMAWEQALRGLERSHIEALLASPPAAGDNRAWRGLADELRSVFATLSAECLDFRSVSAGAMATRSSGEQRRWAALARAQEGAEAFLEKAGLCDPHRGRLQALGRRDLIDPGREVVLVGVVDAIGLVRRLVDSLEHVRALVFAPEQEREAFDEMGCLRPDAWLERRWSLPLDTWRMAVGPDDQARQALEVIASWGGAYTAEQISVGVGDPEVAPFLERGFNEHRVFARNAEGGAHGSTPPARLLAGVLALLEKGRFSDLAGLVRHPDMETHLATCVGIGERSCAEIMDSYQGSHLPGRLPDPWLESTRERGAELDRLAAQLGAAVQDWLAPLRAEPRPLSEWCAPVRAVLEAEAERDETNIAIGHPGQSRLGTSYI